MDDPAVTNALYWLSWMPTVRNFAAALVAAGVVMEFAEGWVSEPWHKIVDHARELQLTSLNNETVRLSAEADSARRETTEAKLQIAQANERAARLESEAARARLELTSLQNPRMVSPDKLSAGLADKPKAKTEIWYVSECSDCQWLATWIAAGLHQAAWEVQQVKPIPIVPGPNKLVGSGAPAIDKGGQPWGVSVLPSDSTNPAAVALSEVLLQEFGRLGGGKASDLPDGIVRVIVAPRP